MLYEVITDEKHVPYATTDYNALLERDDIDRERSIRNQYPGGGGTVGQIYNVAYAKAMLQAALFV